MKKKYTPRNVCFTFLAILTLWFCFWPLYNVDRASSAEIAYSSDELFVIAEESNYLQQGSPLYFLRSLLSVGYWNRMKQNCHIFHLKNGRLSRFTFENAVAPELILYKDEVFFLTFPENKKPRFFKWSGKTFEAVTELRNAQLDSLIWKRGLDAFQVVPGWTYRNANDVLVTARDSTQIPIKLTSGTYQFMMRQSFSQDWQRYFLKGTNLPEQEQELLFIDKTRSTFVSRAAFQKYSGSEEFTILKIPKG